MTAKILIIDDNEEQNQIVSALLRNEGYHPLVANTAKVGLRLAFETRPDLIILDVLMPDMLGWEVCQRLREVSAVPIIFVSGQDDVDDVVHGLEVGGDDYLTKPFHKAELLARVAAQLRRNQQAGQSSAERGVVTPNFSIKYDQREVMAYGQPVELSAREFELLALLTRNVERVVPTSEILRGVWGSDDENNRASLKVYMSMLRRKVEKDPANPQLLVTVRGVGYRFQVPD